MARLCIKSFPDHGHPFRLFSYVEYDSLPRGDDRHAWHRGRRRIRSMGEQKEERRYRVCT